MKLEKAISMLLMCAGFLILVMMWRLSDKTIKINVHHSGEVVFWDYNVN